MVKALNHRQDRDKRIYCFRVERRGWLKRKSLILLNKLHTYNYNVLGIKTIDIHMSNNDSLDEETKRILAEADSDDSKDNKLENDKKTKIKWEENKIDDDDSQW